jgi:hypothetical protein
MAEVRIPMAQGEASLAVRQEGVHLFNSLRYAMGVAEQVGWPS